MKNTYIIRITFEYLAPRKAGEPQEIFDYSFETEKKEFKVLRHKDRKKQMTHENDTIYFPAECCCDISRTIAGCLSLDEKNNTMNFSNYQGKKSKIKSGQPMAIFSSEGKFICILIYFEKK